VVGVGDVLTIHSAPDMITAMLSVDFDDNISAGEVENIVRYIEEQAGQRWPHVRRLFVRPQHDAVQLKA
jgi:hypothetical protein